MNLKLDFIDKDKFYKIDDDTRELIKEFRSGLKATLPTYNSSMILFRTILIHFANDLCDESPQNFSEAIDIIDKEVDFTYDFYKKLHKIKKLSNEITHNYKVLYGGDEEYINDAWDFIKWMVEEIL